MYTMATCVSLHIPDNKIGRCVFHNAVAVATQDYKERYLSLLSQLK